MVEFWLGLLAPPRTPKAVVDRPHKAVTETLNEPELKEKTVRTGSIPLSMTQEEFANLVGSDIRKCKRMLSDFNIKVQRRPPRAGCRCGLT